MTADGTFALAGPGRAARALLAAREGAALVGVLLAAAALSAIYFNAGGWIVDDGAYGYVARRILEGDRLNLDVQDLHAGYVNLVNAAALALFGDDLVSLRYPLAAITVAQAGLAFAALRPAGVAAAATGGLAAAAFGFIVFNNPSANWYAAFLCFAAMAAAAAPELSWRRKALLLGFIVGCAFLFRQATGVFLAWGVTLVMLLELHGNRAEAKGRAGAVLLWALALGVAAFAAKTAQIVGLFLFGAGAVVLLVCGALRVRVGLPRTAAVVGLLVLGACVSVLPLLLLHGVQGSLTTWAEDVFVAPFSLVALPFFEKASYGHLLLANLLSLADGDLTGVFDIVFWCALLLAPGALAVIAGRTILRGEGARTLTPVATLPVFHALVAAHYEIPIYLLFSTGPALVGLLAAAGARRARIAVPAVLALSGAGVWLLAGQAETRSLLAIARNERAVPDAYGLPHASLRIGRETQESRRRVLAVISDCARADEPIFAAPLDADLYYLSGRRSAFRYYGAPFGLRDAADVGAAVTALKGAEAPAVVVHRQTDKYNTGLVYDLMAAVRARYVALGSTDGFDVYAAPWAASRSTCARTFAEARS